MSFLRRLRQTSLLVSTSEQSSMVGVENSDKGLDFNSSLSAGENMAEHERAGSPSADDEGDLMGSGDDSSASSFDDLESVEVPSSPDLHTPSSRGEDITAVDPSSGPEIVKHLGAGLVEADQSVRNDVGESAEDYKKDVASHSNSIPDGTAPLTNSHHSTVVAGLQESTTAPKESGPVSSADRGMEETEMKSPPQPKDVLRETAGIAAAAAGPLPATVSQPQHPPQASEHYDTPLQGSFAPLKKREITILLTGETGTGKTTFMSLLANVCANRTVWEFLPEHNPENDSKLDASQSQTKAAMMYEMVRYDGLILRVLDTPGLCDTRGIEQDALHKGSIANAIREHISNLDAIIILANGTQERLTVPTDYALNTLSAMFPSSIANNIGFLFTNVENFLTFNFQSTSLPSCLQDAELWTIQNPLAMVVKYRERSRSGTVAAKQARLLEKLLDDSYATAIGTLDAMFTWLDERVACPTTEISDLYSKTTNIEAAITDVVARLHQTEVRKNELTALRTQLEKSQQTMKINEQYEKIMQRQMHVQQDTPETHTTQCTAPDCYSNCHEECSLEFLLDPAELGHRCAAFYEHRDLAADSSKASRWALPSRQRRDTDLSDSNALTLKCDTCGHAAQDHRHFHSLWTLETMEELIVDEEAKRSYETAEHEANHYQVEKRRIEKSLEALDTDIISHQKRLWQLCEEFQAAALSGNFAGHLLSTIRMLEYRRAARENDGDVDGVRQLNKMIESFEQKIRVLRDTEEKKRNKWSITRVKNSLARWVAKGW